MEKRVFFQPSTFFFLLTPFPQNGRPSEVADHNLNGGGPGGPSHILHSKTLTWRCKMKMGRILIMVLVLGMLLSMGWQPSQAQVQGPLGTLQTLEKGSLAAPMNDQIPIQGRLTDAGGNPLNGNYSVNFWVYNMAAGGAVICGNLLTNVSVTNGLFNSTLDLCALAGAMKGQQLWLGVQVGTDPEMTPRQPIYPVPYAYTLRSGATIEGDIKQPLASDGLAKAGVYINNCGNGVPTIVRSFNNVNNTAITVTAGASAGECTVDLGFDRSGRFYVATPYGTTAPRMVTVAIGADNQKLNFFRHDETGAGSTGDIMVLIY
jgi:hypothetical protein